MPKIFLDANFLLDYLLKRIHIDYEFWDNFDLVISVLSIHIFCYVTKKRLPDEQVSLLEQNFDFIDISADLSKLATCGPTPDYEDNLQLHSALEDEADYFLTRDKELLKMGVFGKMRIISPQEFVKLEFE
jgi:predicted nucleic acid-binding protein